MLKTINHNSIFIQRQRIKTNEFRLMGNFEPLCICMTYNNAKMLDILFNLPLYQASQMLQEYKIHPSRKY